MLSYHYARLLLAFTIFSMVAEAVYAGGETASSSDNGNGVTAMSKAFAASTKLSETNYMIWYAGLLTVLLGVTTDPYSKLMELLERIQNDLNKTMDHLYVIIGAALFKESPNTYMNSDNWKMLDKVLFNVLYWTIDETIAGLKSSLATTMMFKGLESLKYIHDNYGPGCNTAQVGRAMDIMNETQNSQETAQEYGTRLLSINASLHEKIPDSILKQVFMRGISSTECKSFLLKEVSSSSVNFVNLVSKAKEFDIQEKIVHRGVDGLAAGARRNNSNQRANGSQTRSNNAHNSNPSSNGPKKCDFCNRPNHLWKQCFLLMVNLRPANANHARMDQKRDELLAACSADKRDRYTKWMQENGGQRSNAQQPNAQNVDAEFAFPGEQRQVDGRVAVSEPVAAENENVEANETNAEEREEKQKNAQMQENATPAHGVPEDDVFATLFNHTMELAPVLLSFAKRFLLAAMALTLSAGGLVVALSVILQAAPANGANLATATPQRAETGNLKSTQVNIPHVGTNASIDAFPCSAVPANGVPWDSCAGLWMFNDPAVLYERHTNPINYTVNGATGPVNSKGTGYARVGFNDGKTIHWFDKVYGIYVPGLTETLAGATWSAANLGIETTIKKNVAFITLPNGVNIPCSTQGGVTRCTRIVLARDHTKGKGGSFNSPPLTHARRDVHAQAMTVADKSRALSKAERDDAQFVMWTKKCCGLSPASLRHMPNATVGCTCPADIPPGRGDLKWNASAVAGKSKHSSHPQTGQVKATRFREYVAMDFLEFKINGVKFHAQAFIDYATSHAEVQVSRHRSSAVRNLLWYLNKTDPYAEGVSVMYCQHDNATEFVSARMKDVTLYSGVVQVTTTPYEHEQNGKVERLNQTLQRMVTFCRHDSNCPDFVIPYAIEFAVFVYNVVPVESLEWKSRHECATGSKPDVRGVQRFGCLCRVLKPLELRKHKFDTYTEDCVYLGLCPHGHGTRFLRLSNSKVYVRDDCVVYNDVMPFRSTGGKGSPLNVLTSSAAMHDVFWDQEETLTRQEQETGVPQDAADVPIQPPSAAGATNATTVNAPRTNAPPSPQPMASLAPQTPPTSGRSATPSPSSERLSSGLGTPSSGAYSPMRPDGVSKGYSPMKPSPPKQAPMKPLKPSADEQHGTVSTKTSRGEWNEGHCSNSACVYPAGHAGPCSDAVRPVSQGLPSRNTRAAKALHLQQQPTLPSVDEEAPENATEPEEIELDAFLAVTHDAYTMPKMEAAPQPILKGSDPTADSDEAYATCVDAYIASLDLSCVDAFVATRKQSNKTRKAKTNTVWWEPSSLDYEAASIRVELGIATTEDKAILQQGTPPKNTGHAFDVTLPRPTTLEEAIASPNWHAEKGYRYATIRELQSWVKHSVLQDRGSPPDWSKLLKLSFLYSFKTDKKGNFDRGKLRIIVLGHKWAAKQGEHYFDNFSHTVAWPNLRACMGQACLDGFTIAKQWDSHAAFLYADAEPGALVYTRVPPELQAILGLPEVAYVAKAAYGLPSAPAGFQKFAARVLTEDCKLKPCKHDGSVFVRRRGKEFIFVCTWVDDFCVLSNSERLYTETRDKYFSVVDGDEGPLEYLLGVNVDVDEKAHRIKIYSEKAIKAILQKYGEPRHPSSVPCRVDLAELKDLALPERGSPLHAALKDRAARYMSLSHAILYIASTTRPDIAYTIGILLRAGDNPTEQHLEALEVLLAYLADTASYGLTYSMNAEVGALTAEYSGLKEGIFSLSDSDWSSGKSISGYVIFLAGAPVLWVSKLQPVTSLSSAEAEYYAASACGAAVVATRLFLSDLDAEPIMPTPIFIDNSACVDLAKDFKSCKRAKHIDRRVNFLTDYKSMGLIDAVSIGTSENTADAFTKPLAKPVFQKHAEALVRP